MVRRCRAITSKLASSTLTRMGPYFRRALTPAFTKSAQQPRRAIGNRLNAPPSLSVVPPVPAIDRKGKTGAQKAVARAREAEGECLEKIVKVFQKRGAFDQHALGGDGLDLEDEAALDWIIGSFRQDEDHEFLAIAKFLKLANPNRPSALLRRIRSIRGYRRRAEKSRARALEDCLISAERSQIQF